MPFLRKATVMIVVIAAAVCGMTPPASGQALPIFPDPILVEEVEAWQDHLDLSNEQMRAVLRLHETYRQEFSELRESTIQRFQDTITELVPLFSGIMFGDVEIPARKELEEVLRRSKQVTAGIQSVDRGFFDEVEEVLTSGQADQLEIQRLHRGLSHFRITQMILSQLNRGLRLDLTEVLLALDVDSERRRIVEQAMLGNLRLTLPRARRLHEDMYQIVTIVLDLIDELNLRDMKPEQMMMLGMDGDLVTRLKGVFDESSRTLQEGASKISRSQLAVMKQLIHDLPIEAAEEIRRRGLRRAYPRAAGRYVRVAEKFDAVEDMPIDEGRQEEVRVLRDSLESRTQPILLQMAELREDERSYRTVDELESRQWSGSERFEKLQSRQGEMFDDAQEALDVIIGIAVDEADPIVTTAPSRVAQDQRWTTRRGGSNTSEVRDGKDRLDAQVDEETGFRPRLTWVAAPIPVGDVRLIASVLEVDPAETAIIDVIYDQYRGSYEALLDDVATESIEIDEEDDEGFDALAEEASDAVQTLDAAFYRDLAISNAKWEETGRLEMLAGARTRSRGISEYGLSSFMDAGGNHEPATDLVTVLSKADRTALTPLARKSIWGKLQEYTVKANRLAAALSGLLEKFESMQKTMNEWSGRGGDTDTDRRIAQAVRKKLNDTVGALRDGASDMVMLNRRTLSSIESTLSADDGLSFRRLYEEAAFPDVFRDREAIFDEIEAARGYPGLSGVQRRDLDNILIRYRTAYDIISSQMVSVQSGANWGRPEEGIIGSADVDLILDLQKMKFQREEVNNAAMAEVKALLEIEQFQELFVQ